MKIIIRYCSNEQEIWKHYLNHIRFNGLVKIIFDSASLSTLIAKSLPLPRFKKYDDLTFYTNIVTDIYEKDVWK